MAPHGSLSRAALVAAALALASSAAGSSCSLGEACGEQDVEAAEEASADALRVELLQTRGKLLSARSAAKSPIEELLNGTSFSTLAEQAKDNCSGEGLGLAIQNLAPECLRACPSLCPRAIPAIATALEDNGAQLALCAYQAALECATGPQGAEACAAVVALAPRMLPVAGSPAALRALCSGGAGPAGAAHAPQGLSEFAAGALARRGGADPGSSHAVSLEASVEEKAVFPPCEGKKEGLNCMPPDGSEYSNSRVYCTQGKYQLPGTKIKTCQPELSRCYGWPAECDDPFCRNGGADRGDGLYCHRGMIVSCTGDDAPVTENACSDGRTTLSQDCTRVQERHCVQRGDQFFCEDGDSRLEGACNDWDNNFTPRRRRGWNYYDDNDAQRRRGSSPRRSGSPSKYYYGD